MSTSNTSKQATIFRFELRKEPCQHPDHPDHLFFSIITDDIDAELIIGEVVGPVDDARIEKIKDAAMKLAMVLTDAEELPN